MALEKFKKLMEITDKNVLKLQEAKEKGKKVVGQYCIYSPDEIALAAGAIPVGLCGTKNDSIAAAESVLPRTLCPLIKSSFGFVLQDSCPYLSASDFVVADATCDGKKKMYELLAEHKNMMVLQLPQKQDEEAHAYWRGEFAKLVKRLEKEFNVQISDEDLRNAIRLNNTFYVALKRVLDSGKSKCVPLSGMQLLELSFKVGYMPDRAESVALLNEVADELDKKIAEGQESTAPRLLLTGVPLGMGSHKVMKLLEDAGARVVCIDNCISYKKTRQLVPETGDPLSALARRYLDIPCAVMSPNQGRYDTIKDLSADFSVDAVVDLTWQGCQVYDVEAHSVKKYVKESLKLPYLQILSDYSEADAEQLKVRIEAFLEMIKK